MVFRLYSTGKIAAGSDESSVVAELQKVTGLSAEEVREKLLNGQPRKLVSSEDQQQIEELHLLLSQAGLQVEMVQGDKPQTARGRTHRLLLPVVALLLLIVIGVGGYGWYWLNRPLPAAYEQDEVALADGTLIAIAHLDVARIVTLKQQWQGKLDPQALPVPAERLPMLKSLFSGEANFSENLQQAFVAFHSSERGGEGKAVHTLLFQGTFDSTPIIAAMRDAFQIESIGEGRWSLLALEKKVEAGACPEPEKKTKRPPTPGYMQITPQRLLISSSQAQLEYMATRLDSDVSAQQELGEWRDYRGGQLASLMVFLPQEASKAANGFAGMMAKKAIADTPQLTRIATRVGLDPLNAGLLAGLHLNSSDAGWSGEKAALIEGKLAEWTGQGETLSPALNSLLSRVSVEADAGQLALELKLGSEMLNELSQTVEDGVKSLFFGGIRAVGGGNTKAKPTQEQLVDKPNDFSGNATLAQLPDYALKGHEHRPLFMQGSFAVNLEEIKRDKDEVFELRLKGEVALPEAGFGVKRVATTTLWVDEVLGSDGENLLRDEACLKVNSWGGRNHEPTSGENTWNNRGSVEKRLRLREGVYPEAIDSIKGRMEFTAPLHVTRLEVPLKAGAVVEHRGLRLFINKAEAKSDSVSYRLSGSKQRFVELRAYNAAGKMLQSGWSIRPVGKDDVTQGYRGSIHSLALYVVEQSVKKQVDFKLSGLFDEVQGGREFGSRDWFAPQAIPTAQWDRYLAVDMNKLHDETPDNKQQRYNRKEPPVATMSHSPVVMELRHSLTGWNNQPAATIYYPMLEALPGVLSVLSYRIEQPAGEDSGKEHYLELSYPYFSGGDKAGQTVAEHHIDGLPFARVKGKLQAGVKKGEKVERLKGTLRFRLPTKTRKIRLPLSELWQGKDEKGMTITLDDIGRGMFPGYSFKVEGTVEQLVNLHGISATGERIAATPVDFQQGGYWTMTIPFSEGMKEIELVLAEEQKIYDYPFDLRPSYSEE